MCHVLVIEDDFLIADHIIQLIARAGGTSFDQAASQDEAIDAARLRPPSIIMSDVNLSAGTGPAAVEAIILEHGPTPVIFVTGTREYATSVGHRWLFSTSQSTNRLLSRRSKAWRPPESAIADGQ